MGASMDAARMVPNRGCQRRRSVLFVQDNRLDIEEARMFIKDTI